MILRERKWARHEKRKRFAILPTEMEDGKIIWLEFYWKSWHGPGYSWLSTWWTNTLTPPEDLK